MSNIIPVTSGLAVLWLIFKVIRLYLNERHYAALATENDCQSPVAWTNKWPLGIDFLSRILKSVREKQFPVDSAQRFSDLGRGVFTYQYSVLGSTSFSTCDPRNLQTILATKFNDYSVGHRVGTWSPLLGIGIFTSDGKEWQHARSMLRPQFVRDQVSDLNLEERHVQTFLRALPLSSSKDWTTSLDLQTYFFRLTLDTATEFLFGDCVNSQAANMPWDTSIPFVQGRDERQFAQAFEHAQHVLALRTRFQKFYWLYSPVSFREACNDAHAFVDSYIDRGLREHNAKSKLSMEKSDSSEGRYIFMDALLTQTQDRNELRSHLISILLAGRDTTASLLGWLFFLLARQPKIFSELRAAVIEHFGTFSEPREITYASLRDCKYLQQCLKETLRLCPVIPLNGRQALKDTILPTGGGPDGKSPILVRKGQMVSYQVYAMHHRVDIWGEDAEEFKPSRWEKKTTGWEYLPFNGGPRICIGQQFALTEVSYVTVRMLQRFDSIENLDPEISTQHNMSLTDTPGTGVKVRLHLAD